MYGTPAAKDLIDRLHRRDAWAMERRRKAEHDIYERGLYDGWHSSLQMVIEDLERALPDIEEQAELLPPPSAEEWMEQEHMAGDLRDWPAA